MALLILTDGTPRTVQLAHKPPFTFEELRILLQCRGLEFHRLYKSGPWAWLFLDANAANLPNRKERNDRATELWKKECQESGDPDDVLGDAMLLTAEEFQSTSIDGEDHERDDAPQS